MFFFLSLSTDVYYELQQFKTCQVDNVLEPLSGSESKCADRCASKSNCGGYCVINGGTAPWSVPPVRANWRARLHLHLMPTWNELPKCRLTHIGRSRGARDAPPPPLNTHTVQLFFISMQNLVKIIPNNMLVPPLQGLPLLQHYHGI